MHLFITILLTLFASQLTAEIYSWEDKNGVTHFSESKPDTPVKKMITIQTPELPKTENLANELDLKNSIKLANVEEKLSQALLSEE